MLIELQDYKLDKRYLLSQCQALREDRWSSSVFWVTSTSMLSSPCRHNVAFWPEVSFKSVSQRGSILFLVPEDFIAIKVKSLFTVLLLQLNWKNSSVRRVFRWSWVKTNKQKSTGKNKVDRFSVKTGRLTSVIQEVLSTLSPRERRGNSPWAIWRKIKLWTSNKYWKFFLGVFKPILKFICFGI